MDIVNYMKTTVILIIICYLCGIVLLLFYMGLAIVMKWYNKLINKYRHGEKEES